MNRQPSEGVKGGAVIALVVAALLALAVGALFSYQKLADLREFSLKRGARDSATLLQRQLEAGLEQLKGGVALLAESRELVEALRDPSAMQKLEINPLLDRFCRQLKATACYLMDPGGFTLASSNRAERNSFVGKNYGFRPYFKQAIQGRPASYLALGVTSGRRGIYFSHPVRNSQGEILGVAVMKYPPQVLEALLSAVSGIASLVDPNGIVFLSNRPDWRFRSLQGLTDHSLQALRDSRQFGEGIKPPIGLQPVADGRVAIGSGHTYLQYRQAVASLPGWSLLYLADEQLAGDGGSASHLIWGLAVIFLAFVTLVLFMYQRSDRARREAQAVRKALTHSEERFRRLSEITREALFIHDQGRCLDANKAAEQMFGYSHDAFIGMHASTIIAPQSLDLVMQKVREGDEQPYEALARRRDGEIFPVEITGKSVHWQGRVVRVASFQDISQRKQQEQQILRQAHYDALTGLPNRVLCRDRISHAIERARRSHSSLAVLFIDLDDFKKINDTLGHQTGDQLLVEAAQRLQGCLRDEDTLSRHGGDEFLLLLEDLREDPNSEVVAEKILNAMARPFRIDGMDLVVTSSIGIALYPQDGKDYPTLLRNADIAMYKAKEEGKNSFHYYTPEMNREAHRHLELDRHLRQALENRELSLLYQPIWDCVSLEMIDAEALLRWNNPALGFVSPAEFIPLAEQTGLISEIGDWVLDQSCRQMRHWLDLGCGPSRVSVNVSPRQLHQANFIERLEACLERYWLAPEHLVLEMTEGLLIQNDPRVMATIGQLRRIGIELSMDDFGTGYSSLGYLRRFPFSNLKIDRAFISDCSESIEARTLVKAIIAMAHGLGLQVIAEGVESRDQLDLLRRYGCDRIQGYLLGHPMSSEQLLKLAESRPDPDHVKQRSVVRDQGKSCENRLESKHRSGSQGREHVRCSGVDR